ncbi:MAG TPA: MmcQ/YjbR family DNA-binding protein [Candidatus Elarobacter sp.]|nr:MmcQ/YjbR family DNA-binding protein [Candidatus Elarobacter sp.]
MTAKKKSTDPTARLRERALSFPGAWEDDPWGDSVIKVGKKIFVFLGDETLTLKLAEAHEAAMSVPGAKPTPYGLGKAGWVTLPLAGAPPADILCDWLEESYRLIAPKKLIKELSS